MRKRCCFSIVGIAILLAGIGVGLYFILKPKAEDSIDENGVSFQNQSRTYFYVFKVYDLCLLLFFSDM